MVSLNDNNQLINNQGSVLLESGLTLKNKYDILEEIGRGRYGVVHKVIDKANNEKLAAKFIKCRISKEKVKVMEEINIMNILQHPKLLQLIAVFENPREIIMILEYISGGELFERVVADDFSLTERDCILFLRQICEGVSYMHKMSIVHLDLKPENIMCYTRTSHQIKIIDFGLAQKLEAGIPVRVLFGTPEFIPPEIINYEPIGIQSDMWSIGVICYVLLSGLSPFMGDNDAETFANITRADYDFNDEAFDAVSEDARNFIKCLLIKKKEYRLTADQCLQHRWMNEPEKLTHIILSTDKLKKFIIRRKWQKTGNAIRAVGRLTTLSANRRNSNTLNSSLDSTKSISNNPELCIYETNNVKPIIQSTSSIIYTSTSIRKKEDFQKENTGNEYGNTMVKSEDFSSQNKIFSKSTYKSSTQTVLNTLTETNNMNKNSCNYNETNKINKNETNPLYFNPKNKKQVCIDEADTSDKYELNKDGNCSRNVKDNTSKATLLTKSTDDNPGSSNLLRSGSKISDKKIFFEKNTIKQSTLNKTSPIERNLDTTSMFAKATAFWNKF